MKPTSCAPMISALLKCWMLI